MTIDEQARELAHKVNSLIRLEKRQHPAIEKQSICAVFSITDAEKIIKLALLRVRNEALKEAASIMDSETCYTELGDKIRALKTEV